MGLDLGSSLFASSATISKKKNMPKITFLQVGAEGFFMAAILYPRLEWVKVSFGTYFTLNIIHVLAFIKVIIRINQRYL